MFERWLAKLGGSARVVNLGGRGYPEFVRVVGIQALQERLTEYVNLASGGETVLVTEGDVVVAALGPAHPMPPRAEVGAFEDLVRQGLVRPATRPRGTVPPSKPVMSTERLLADLREDRDAR
jgi:antitoxin (DNA-binding transcriptional repressor) of toxin-antitoxin stability system